jgi:hypothetical protein
MFCEIMIHLKFRNDEVQVMYHQSHSCEGVRANSISLRPRPEIRKARDIVLSTDKHWRMDIIANARL